MSLYHAPALAADSPCTVPAARSTSHARVAAGFVFQLGGCDLIAAVHADPVGTECAAPLTQDGRTFRLSVDHDF